LTVVIFLSVYLGLGVFAVGCIIRIVHYARMPLHLRWELYPVPHEAPEHARHGGSYFEEQQWWSKPQSAHLLPEWRAMFEEMIFLKSLRLHHFRLWRASFPFHFGLYLVIASVALASIRLILGGLYLSQTFFSLFGSLASLFAMTGSAAVLLGSLLLLIHRLSDPGQRNTTKPADIFNLIFFLVVFTLLMYGGLFYGSDFARPSAVLRGLVHFDSGMRINPVFAAGLILSSALMAYIPYTHMAHFIGKYFAWHSVRWDDRRNEPLSAGELRIAEYLSWAPRWSARHIGADGSRSWAEIASTNPSREVNK
jgi:nitrate reductase gamma subunit